MRYLHEGHHGFLDKTPSTTRGGNVRYGMHLSHWLWISILSQSRRCRDYMVTMAHWRNYGCCRVDITHCQVNRKQCIMGVGMPTTLLLDEFGYLVWTAFGDWPYHVGSSVMGKTWRDVDVRLILPDEGYERMGLGDPKRPHHNEKWVALTLAFSALGKAMTGL